MNTILADRLDLATTSEIRLIASILEMDLAKKNENTHKIIVLDRLIKCIDSAIIGKTGMVFLMGILAINPVSLAVLVADKSVRSSWLTTYNLSDLKEPSYKKLLMLLAESIFWKSDFAFSKPPDFDMLLRATILDLEEYYSQLLYYCYHPNRFKLTSSAQSNVFKKISEILTSGYDRTRDIDTLMQDAESIGKSDEKPLSKTDMPISDNVYSKGSYFYLALVLIHVRKRSEYETLLNAEKVIEA